MKNWKKIIAIVLVIALAFGIWQGPIKVRADKLENQKQDTKDLDKKDSTSVDTFTIPYGEKSYLEYTITDEEVVCVYNEYIGDDEQGNPIYDKKSTTTPIIPEISIEEMEDNEEDDSVELEASNNTPIYRSGEKTTDQGNPLYWQKNVKEKLKKLYYYQVGVKGNDVYYRIGGEQSYAVNYTGLNDEAKSHIDLFIGQIDLINKQLMQCLLAAVGAVMLAISAIIASYTAVGASVCSTLVAPILKKFGVQLLQITPIGFGKMVFKMYDDYQDLKYMYCQAATHGSIFTP